MLCLIRHGHGAEDDRIALWAARRDVAARSIRPFAGEALPDPAAASGAVVYGGMFNAFETARHPFLRDEMEFMLALMAAGKPVLAICQGAQQLAHALGAAVGPRDEGAAEFGHYALRAAPGQDIIPDGLVVPQAHYHGFALPAGCQRLAGTALFPVQAMRTPEGALAFQFHPEVTLAGFARWQARADELWGRPGVQPRKLQDETGARSEPALSAWFMALLDRHFAALLPAAPLAPAAQAQ